MPQPSDSQRFFDQVAPEWETLRARMFGQPLLDALIAALDARPGETALDVGAGSGFVTKGLLDAGLRVVALDASPAMRAELAARFGGDGRVTVLGGDAEALDLATNSLDRATGNMFLHHVERPERAVRELFRVVKPGGVVAIADLDAHTDDGVRAAHHDRWMGFPRDVVAGWMAAAGFEGVVLDRAPEGCRDSCSSDAVALSIFIATGRKPAGAPPSGREAAQDSRLRKT